MGVEQFTKFDEYTAQMKVAFSGADCDSEFATAFQNLDLDGETHQVVSEAHITRDRNLGNAIVRGLRFEYSFDMTDSTTNRVDCDFGDSEDLAKEAMATAIEYER